MSASRSVKVAVMRLSRERRIPRHNGLCRGSRVVLGRVRVAAGERTKVRRWVHEWA